MLLLILRCVTLFIVPKLYRQVAHSYHRWPQTVRDPAKAQEKLKVQPVRDDVWE